MAVEIIKKEPKQIFEGELGAPIKDRLERLFPGQRFDRVRLIHKLEEGRWNAITANYFAVELEAAVRKDERYFVPGLVVAVRDTDIAIASQIEIGKFDYITLDEKKTHQIYFNSHVVWYLDQGDGLVAHLNPKMDPLELFISSLYALRSQYAQEFTILHHLERYGAMAKEQGVVDTLEVAVRSIKRQLEATKNSESVLPALRSLGDPEY